MRSRGLLQVFLGYAPGVGKTSAMIRAAAAAAAAGTDVVVGLVEDHGRSAVAAQAAALPRVPGRLVGYAGTLLPELDVAAVLDRQPAVVVVDELAHSVVGAGHHTDRWQDVQELRAAGIDVYTTVNAANIASLADLVREITQVAPVERVPDNVVRHGEIHFVDLAPGQLRNRIRAGQVHTGGAAAALDGYYSLPNLVALRELTRVWLRGCAPAEVDRFRAVHQLGAGVAPTPPVAVGVDGSAADDALVVAAAAAAAAASAELVGIHVRVVDGLAMKTADPPSELFESYDGRLIEVAGADVASALVAEARALGATRLFIGAGTGRVWHRLLRPSVARSAARLAPEIDVRSVPPAAG